MDTITLAHGAGGLLTQQLLDDIIRPAFNNPLLSKQHDGAHIQLPTQQIAMSTDSYVVRPLVFHGGDIGKLAVFGTVNDLAMCGAKAMYLSCSFILSEGLAMSTFKKMVHSMAQAAMEANVQIVTGDIKTIDKTEHQDMYINTTGIGAYLDTPLSPQGIQAGDSVILSGDIGRHGLAILCEREQLEFSPPIQSDCANLFPAVEKLLRGTSDIHCIRDLTRGGLVGNLIEMANTISAHINIHSDTIPVSQGVHAGCELLGLDPLFIANEGRMVVFCHQGVETEVLDCLNPKRDPLGAKKIGNVISTTARSRVTLTTPYGSQRLLTLPVGEQYPRIC